MEKNHRLFSQRDARKKCMVMIPENYFKKNFEPSSSFILF